MIGLIGVMSHSTSLQNRHTVYDISRERLYIELMADLIIKMMYLPKIIK